MCATAIVSRDRLSLTIYVCNGYQLCLICFHTYYSWLCHFVLYVVSPDFTLLHGWGQEMKPIPLSHAEKNAHCKIEQTQSP